MGRRWAALLVLVGLLARTSLARASDAGGTVERDLSQTLVVGVQDKSFPYAFKDKDGKLRGFAIDVTEAVARVMGLHLEWRTADPDPRLLQSGAVDMIALLAETPTRRLLADFSVPLLRMETVVLIRKGDARIRRLADLAGKRVGIGATAGTVGHDYLLQEHPQAIPVLADNADAVLMVARGELDAVILARHTALSQFKSMGLDSLDLLPERVVGHDVRRCFAVRRGDALLLARLNEGLDIVRQTGEFDEIRARWMGPYEPQTFTRLEMLAYLAVLLTLATIVITMALLRQRQLSRRVIRQSDELTEQRRLLAALYEKHPLATLVLRWRTGESPRLESWNSQATQLLGLSLAIKPGHPVDELPVPADIKTLLAEVVTRWQSGAHSDPWETHTTSSHRILETTLMPLGLWSSGASRACVLIGDVTQRRLADQSVAQARRLHALGEMVGGIAHEFNNLLTPIAATVEFLRQSPHCQQQNSEELRLIEDAAGRATELTRRLLTFGRKTEAVLRSVRMADVAANCLALLRPACDRGIEWITQIPPDLPALEFNPTDLNQILLNLIINARDALQEKGQRAGESWSPRIVIRAEEERPEAHAVRPSDAGRQLLGWQVLSVEDNGTGIPSGVIDRIFEPFFTTKDVGRGTGIGLATVWHLVTDAGGTVSVESREGKGTQFHVVLPRWQSDLTPTPTPSPVLVAHAGPKLRVLLVEDEPLLARVCTRGLTGLGHQVTYAADGVAAWARFEKGEGEAHEVLLTDVSMPRMGGLDLVRRVRGTKFRGRVVLMSGRVDNVTKEEIRALRIDYVLAKPFTVAGLLVAMGDGRPTWRDDVPPAIVTMPGED